jgi:hypothetical protein
VTGQSGVVSMEDARDTGDWQLTRNLLAFWARFAREDGASARSVRSLVAMGETIPKRALDRDIVEIPISGCDVSVDMERVRGAMRVDDAVKRLAQPWKRRPSR